MRTRNPFLTTEYTQDLKLFRGRLSQVGLLALLALYLYLPSQLDNAWLGILNYIAMAAIGAIGLNLLTGFTGQVSLGHAFFMACGAFTAAYCTKNDWPFPLWLLAAVVVGGVLGALVGPVALRLHGNYLAIVTIGLLFLGQHIFTQIPAMRSITGGNRGTRIDASFAIGPIDFAELNIFGMVYDKEQGLFWLLWALVAIVALVAKNIVRSRPGRAMQAIRDRDIAAEIMGISLTRYKLGAFALSSALAAMAGALYGAAIQGFVSAEEFGGIAGLIFSITFVAIIIIGGMGTVFGSILGAAFVVGLQRIISRYSDVLPFLGSGSGADAGIISVASFNNAIFGVLLVVFLLVEPLGLAGVWTRIKMYFKLWPFSY